MTRFRAAAAGRAGRAPLGVRTGRLPRLLVAAVAAAGGLIALSPGVASAVDPTTSTSTSTTSTTSTPTTSTIDSPGPGPYTSATSLTLAGTVRRPPVATDPVSLQLTDPAGVAQTIATRTGNGPMSVQWQTRCAYDLASCGQPGTVRPARNGTWTLSMVGDTGDPAPSSRTFVLTISPTTPGQVSVIPTPGGAQVSWQNGGEPDLTGADLLADNKIVATAPACSGHCSATVKLSAGNHTIAVREHRARCPRCSGDLMSAASAATPVTVSAALAAPGLRQGGALSAAAERALNSGAGPGRSVPGQPSAKANDGEPTQDGTYGSYLPYSDSSPATDAAGGHGTLAASKTALNWRGVLLPVSAALILALGSLHLRRWARPGAAIIRGGKSRR